MLLMSSPLLPPLLCINGFYPHLPLLPPSSVSFCSNVKLPFRLLWRMMCRLFFRLVPCHKTALQPKPFHFGFLFLISLCSSQHLYRSGHALTTYLHCNLSLAFILSLPLGFIFVLLLPSMGFFVSCSMRDISRERERALLSRFCSCFLWSFKVVDAPSRSFAVSDLDLVCFRRCNLLSSSFDQFLSRCALFPLLVSIILLHFLFHHPLVLF